MGLVGPNGRQDDAARRDPRRTSLDGGRIVLGHGSCPVLSQHTLEPRSRAPCSMRPPPRPASSGPRTGVARRFFSGWDTHERSVTALSGGERRRLRWPCSSPLDATSRPRRADEPPRRRVARGARGSARGVPGTILLVRTTARLSTPCRPDRRVRGSRAALVRRRVGGPGASARRRSSGRAASRSEDRLRPAAIRSARRARTRHESHELGLFSLDDLAVRASRRTTRARRSAQRDDTRGFELARLLERWEVLFAEARTP